VKNIIIPELATRHGTRGKLIEPNEIYSPLAGEWRHQRHQ